MPAANDRLFVTPTKPRFERSVGGKSITCTTNNKKSAQASSNGKNACAKAGSKYRWLKEPAPSSQVVEPIGLQKALANVDAGRTENKKALYSCRYPQQFELKAGQILWLPCRKCNACKGNRINDLTGKLIAESLSCYDVWFWTLTYDDKLIADQDINPTMFRVPEHVQNFINAIRMQCKRACGDALNAKYFACYEKGEQRQRGHWHVLLFWKTETSDHVLRSGSVGGAMAENPKPAWMMRTNLTRHHPAKYRNIVNDPEIIDLMGGGNTQQYTSVWPYGRVSVESLFRGPQATSNIHKAMAYPTKYVTKEPQRYLCSYRMGQDYFDALVAAKIDAGLQINDLTYSFSDQRKLATYKERLREQRSWGSSSPYIAKDRRRVYQLQGVARDRAIRHAVRRYRDRVKHRWRRNPPPKPTLAKFRDDMSLRKVGREAERRRWERYAYTMRDESPKLDRLTTAAKIQFGIAEEVQAEQDATLEKLRRYRTPANADYYNPVAKKRREIRLAHGLPIESPPQSADPEMGPAMRKRFEVLTRKKGSKRKVRQGFQGAST